MKRSTNSGKQRGNFVLVLNAGSSSLRFALFECGGELWLDRGRGLIEAAAWLRTVRVQC